MQNASVIKSLAGSADMPVVVKDGDVYYQIQGIVEDARGFVQINLGSQFQPSSAQPVSSTEEPVGIPDEAPEETPEEDADGNLVNSDGDRINLDGSVMMDANGMPIKGNIA